MKPLFRWGLVLAVGAGAAIATQPRAADPDLFTGITPAPENGALVFAAMGCASCHMAPEDGTPDALPGGKQFATAFGTFVAPNISPDPTNGIGAWTDIDIASAVLHGTSPDGQHLYPAFPYTSYAKTTPQDLADLIAHLRSLPPQTHENIPHDVGFPFNIRMSLGGWKLLFANDDWVVTGDLTAQQTRGRYLVEALGHCGECHTPRSALGGVDRDNWLAGAPNPSGDGNIPSLRSSDLDWSDDEIADYLQTGFTPDYDTAGGSMAEVVKNLSQLPSEDIDAIVSYLRLVPSQ